MTYLIDLVIMLLLVLGAVINYKKGFMVATINLLALVIGLVAAALLYRPLASWVLEFYKTYPAVINVLAYVGVLVMAQFAWLNVARHFVHKLPRKVELSRVNTVGGACIGLFQMAALVAICLTLFLSLPVSSANKERVSNSFFSRPLLQMGNNFDVFLSVIPGNDFTQALNLLIVKPESDQSVELGFTTSNVENSPQMEARMLVLVNNERAHHGLTKLTPNEAARSVARRHSIDMFARGYFAHINPEGLDPFERMQRGGVHFLSAGENLALAPTLKQAHVGLMNSPGHRANILSPNFGTVGIGVIDGGPYGLMITQNFTN